ncbi:MAG: primosomal protein N' [Rhodospirillales bacterium CG15_BIG_FIL_POST_REV_8_21_14_020_66_15]|nr:MAG: primosomal protein N' [Rhodospirillales bacterium CG15_BIG_FIL_POST_REV_8_21_14_020_66_15]
MTDVPTPTAERDAPRREPQSYAPGACVAVRLPLPLTDAYDYRVPDGLTLATGDFVRVPLGPRKTVGVVWGPGTGDVPDNRMKAVIQRLDAPPMTAEAMAFADWVADYTLHPPGAVLRMALSVPEALDPPKVQTAYRAAEPRPGTDKPGIRMTPARERVLAAADGPPRQAAELARAAGVTPGVVAGLAKAGALVACDLPAFPPPPPPDLSRPGPDLSPEQATAADALSAAVSDGFSVQVLEGVPGSGKTEVYLQAVAETVKAGRQVLVLLPEIALSAQWLERFQARFGTEPALWHSEVTQAQRRETWRHVAEGRADVVVGARSALFLPFRDLGLIVVDEEHDGSFKQEEGVVYNARDMAVVRARLGRIPVVLVSATPSLETQANVDRGRYAHLHLPARHGGADLPEVLLVDMTRNPPQRGQWLSPPLREAVTRTLERGEQALLFLNRRGYAPLTLCRTCGHRLQCPQCTAWLVEHRLLQRLQCHHCGHQMAPPHTCPACGAEDSLVPCGPGVERLAEEIQALYPDARVALATSDNLYNQRTAREFVRRIERHEVDLIIGTQIVAKGYHFPLLTLVGVIDADLGLSGGDLRAAERTYQLLYQVAGRAGRAEHPGRVLVQTYMPEHPVMAAIQAGNREEFIRAEAKSREEAHMPPYGRLVGVVVSGTDEAAVDAGARALGRTAPRGPDVQVLGPAPAPLAMIRGRHRRRLLLKAGRATAVQPLVRAWIKRAQIPRKVRVLIDVDPYSFM